MVVEKKSHFSSAGAEKQQKFHHMVDKKRQISSLDHEFHQ